MHKLARLFAVLCLLPGGSCSLEAQLVQARHARVELLAQTAGISPNQQLWLGVHFSLEQGWHIYWRNPGDSGQPPVFHWQLPPGLSAGEVQWPRPNKMKTASLADY